MATMRVYNPITYGAPPNETIRCYEWDADVEVIEGIAGRILCPGCSGQPVDADERDNTDLDCIECKDTGFVLVSI